MLMHTQAGTAGEKRAYARLACVSTSIYAMAIMPIMGDKMAIKFVPLLRVVRNYYGEVIQATFLDGTISLAFLPSDQKYQTYKVKTTKDLVQVMLQSGTRALLFNAAWREAVRDGAVSPCRKLDVDDGEQSIEQARADAMALNAYISQKVNDPNSRF